MFNKLYTLYNKKKILKRFLDYGTNLDLDFNSVFVEPERMSFGNNVFINRNSFLSGSIKFNNNIMIGPNFTAFSDNHKFGKIGKSIMNYSKDYNRGKILIEDECWLGADVKIFGNVCIGLGSVIAGGSILTKDIPPFSLVVGTNNIKKKIIQKKNIIKHLELLNYNENDIKSVLKRLGRLINGVSKSILLSVGWLLLRLKLQPIVCKIVCKTCFTLKVTSAPSCSRRGK